MVRRQMNFKRLSLTDIKIDIKRVPKKKDLTAAIKSGGKSCETSSATRAPHCSLQIIPIIICIHEGLG